MKTRQIVFLTILLAGLMVIAFAQGHDWGGPGGGPEGRPPMRDGMGGPGGGMYGDMTPDTIAKVKIIMAAGEKLAQPHKDKAMAIEKEIQVAFLAKKVDVKKVNALIAKEGSENIAARQAMTASLIKLKPIITEDQFKRKIRMIGMMGGRRRMGNQDNIPAPTSKHTVKPVVKLTSKPVKK
jgi:Spy/CpxP family protein refolding chaperone